MTSTNFMLYYIISFLPIRRKHVSPLRNENIEIVAHKLWVYPGDSEEYYCFITPEAYNSLQEWMNYRAEHHRIVKDLAYKNIWPTTRPYRANNDV